MRSQTFWEKTYHKNIAKMIGVNLRYVGDRAVAEDLAHDAILKAIEKSGSYRHLGSFEGWLMRLNLNNTLDYLRRQPQFLSIDNAPDPAMAETCHDEPPQPDEFTESEILDAICALPERQRVVFNLYVFEKQTHKKIADKLQIGIRSSKRYLSEARTQLQQFLKDKQTTKKSGIMIILMMITRQSHAVDRLCLAKLKNLAVNPVAPSPLASLDWAAVPKSSLWLTLSAAKAPAVATGVVATVVAGSAIAYQARPDNPAAVPQEPDSVETGHAPSLLSGFHHFRYVGHRFYIFAFRIDLGHIRVNLFQHVQILIYVKEASPVITLIESDIRGHVVRVLGDEPFQIPAMALDMPHVLRIDVRPDGIVFDVFLIDAVQRVGDIDEFGQGAVQLLYQHGFLAAGDAVGLGHILRVGGDFQLFALLGHRGYAVVVRQEQLEHHRGVLALLDKFVFRGDLELEVAVTQVRGVDFLQSIRRDERQSHFGIAVVADVARDDHGGLPPPARRQKQGGGYQ